MRVLRTRLLPPGRPGTWHVLWGDQDGGERLVAALDELASPSLFGGSGVLVVRHAEALREDDQARLLGVLESLGAGGSLIMVARAADQRRRLMAACLRAGAAYGFPSLDARAALPWVSRLARERGGEIAPAAAQELVERCGTDLGTLAGEVEKLELHVGAGTRIELQHVRTLTAAVRGHAVEELSNHLARRDLTGAALVLRRLLDEGEPPIRLVAFLAANLRRALHVAELAEAGIAEDTIAQRLGMPPWLVARYRGRGRASDLARTLDVLRELDLQLKSTRRTEAVFDAALLEIAGARAG